MNDKKFTEEMVIERFEEAVRTLRRLPPVRIQGYVSSWPKIIYTESEIAMMDRKPRRCPATSAQISEMEETCKWINLLQKIDDRKIIWLRASRTPWKQVCIELGICRTAANYKWKNAIRTITRKLI